MKKILLLSLIALILLGCLPMPPADQADPTPTKPAMPPATPTQTPVRSNSCATVSANALHVRYGPNEHAQAIGWVTTGTTVTILTPGAWPKISATGIDDQGRRVRMTGYVNSIFLKECEP